MVAHTIGPNIWETEGVQDQPSLPNEFQDSEQYVERPSLKKKKKKVCYLMEKVQSGPV